MINMMIMIIKVMMITQAVILSSSADRNYGIMHNFDFIIIVIVTKVNVAINFLLIIIIILKLIIFYHHHCYCQYLYMAIYMNKYGTIMSDKDWITTDSR